MKNEKSLFYLLFIDSALFLIFFLGIKNTGAALGILFIILLNIALFIIFKTDNMEPEITNPMLTEPENKLDSDELNTSQQVLRYAAAALAVLSWFTTAQGLKSFIFPKAYQAYIGSFAIQAILLVFSFMLCHFYVRIKKIRCFTARTKNILIITLTCFFCASLIFSSTFSYVYISNTTYELIRSRDDNLILEQFLLKTAHSLKEENEKRGKFIKEKLSPQLEALSEISASHKDGLIVQYLDYRKNNPLSSYESLTQLSLTEDAKEKILEANRSRMPKELEQLWENLNNCQKELDRLLKDYNELITKIPGPDDKQAVNTLLNIQSSCKTACENLTNLKISIDTMRGIIYINDLTPYKTALSSSCSSLISQYQNLITYCSSLENILNQELTQSTTTDAGSLALSPESLASLIYLDEAAPEQINDCKNTTAKIMGSMISGGEADQENLMKLNGLQSYLDEFLIYTSLKRDLNDFINTDLKKSCNVSDSLWKDKRKQQFTTISLLLKQLPETGAVQSVYPVEDILSEAYTLERDLLEEISEFEKALHYFKYDFHTMAYVSALIAVFLDLGSFLTGCFMFTSRYFSS